MIALWIEIILDRLFRFKVIVNCERDPYLKRWYVFRNDRHFAILLHKFIRSDEERALHDHPWSFLVIPIWRGYIEHGETCLICRDTEMEGHHCDHPYNHTFIMPTRRRVWPLIGTRFRAAEFKHRVELHGKWVRLGRRVEFKPQPAWSLFIRFRRRREWGFWPEDGFTHWRKWWSDLCED